MNISEECFKEIIEIVEALIEEADSHANSKNPVVKITDKNYRVASGKSLSGPFNKNHVGQYIVYNKDTDASYLVTPDNWKKSKIKRDLERQGKFYEALEETFKLLELFDRPDLLDDIDTLLGSPVKKTFKKVISNIEAPKKEKKVNRSIKEAMKLAEEIINEVSVKKWVEAAGSSLKNKGTAYNDHAKAVYNLPMSNRSANSVVRAATKSMKSRDKKYNDEKNYEIPYDPYRDNPFPVPDEATERNIDRRDNATELAYANKKNYKKQIEANKRS